MKIKQIDNTAYLELENIMSNPYCIKKIPIKSIENDITKMFSILNITKEKNKKENKVNLDLVYKRKKQNHNNNLTCCSFCPDKCCNLVTIRYRLPNHPWPIRSTRPRRAGVLILDPTRKFILLVQSCGKLWGAAKGVMELNETTQETALRELKEETGIEVKAERLKTKIKIGRDTYYVLIYPMIKLKIPYSNEYNDVTGLAWVSLKCLEKNVEFFSIRLNQSAKILIYKGLYICGYIPKNIYFEENNLSKK